MSAVQHQATQIAHAQQNIFGAHTALAEFVNEMNQVFPSHLQRYFLCNSGSEAVDNAVKIALADINNASKERVASITANAQLDNLQLAQQHQQNQTALEAEAQAHADLRKHGLEEVRRQQDQSHQRALAAQQQLVDMQNQSQQQQHQANMAQMQPKQPSPTGE